MLEVLLKCCSVSCQGQATSTKGIGFPGLLFCYFAALGTVFTPSWLECCFSNSVLQLPQDYSGDASWELFAILKLLLVVF